MAKRWALTKRAQYLAVYKSGKAWVDNLIVMKASPNKLDFSRCGFSVTKDVGKAVVRNRIRRLLREVIRITSIKPGWDIVFIARPPAGVAGYHELKRSTEKLLLRARLINENEIVRAGVN